MKFATLFFAAIILTSPAFSAEETNLSLFSAPWKMHKIDNAMWNHNSLSEGDVNADGRKELLGMLIHANKGNLPADKASVYVMTYSGDQPQADNWKTHVIKWGDGVDSNKNYQGEKWDHCRLSDIDRDGDMDIIGNCEEHHDDENNTIIGVVWFENPMK